MSFLAGRGRSIRMLTALGFFSLLAISASGCVKTVLVRRDSPMRIAEPCRVYTLEGGEWVESGNKVDATGWYLVPPEMVEP